MWRCPEFLYLGVIFNLFSLLNLKEFFNFYVLAHSAHVRQFVLTYTHIIWCLLNVFDDILYHTLTSTHPSEKFHMSYRSLTRSAIQWPFRLEFAKISIRQNNPIFGIL